MGTTEQGYILIIYALVGGIWGFGMMYVLQRWLDRTSIKEAEENALRIKHDAKKEADALERENLVKAKEALYHDKKNFNQEYTNSVKQFEEMEKRLLVREKHLTGKSRHMEVKEEELREREERTKQLTGSIEKFKTDLDHAKKDYIIRLEQKSDISREKIGQEIVEQLVENAKLDTLKQARYQEEELRSTADKRAKELIGTIIQRYSSDNTDQRSGSVIMLPKAEQIKKITGKNLSYLKIVEDFTDVICTIDREARIISISGDDPVKREVAKLSIERLIKEKRINNPKIEKIVKLVYKDIDKLIVQTGRRAARILKINNIHPEILKLLGRLKFRTSYSQNVLNHSIECAFFAGMIASELGLSVEIAKRAALLHDIGKALDHEVDGSHALLGCEVARKYGEKDIILNAIGGHHEEQEAATLYPRIVQASDALSGGRPGARSEMLGSYMEWIEELENFANAFSGVKKSFAMQAGRELRVMVHDSVSEDETYRLARDIARKVENDLTYPGQIKVVTIREKWTTAIAN